MLILYLSGREAEYTRNDVLVRALKRFASVDVLSESGPGRILFRSLRQALRALPYLLRNKPDLVVVGFYGHLLMLPIGLFSRAPVIFDAFISTYDTLIQDRRQIRAGSMGAWLARWLDRTACGLSEHILIDTPEHRAYFQSELGVSGEKISALPVGCNEDLFFPRPAEPHNSLAVLYYCTYLPLHGADVVVEAALRLQHQADIQFRLIGQGPEYHRVRALADQLNLENVEFLPPIPLAELADEICQADICLGGHFGPSQKAGRVIPGKIYQILAMARPLLAADTPANTTLLTPGEHALFCPPGDPDALALAISNLAADPAKRADLGQAGRALYLACCSEAAITRALSNVVDRLVG